MSPNLLLCSIAVVFAVGLGAFISLLAPMAQGDGLNPIFIVAAGLTFVATLLLEASLLWLLLRGRKGARVVGGAARSGGQATMPEQATKELAEGDARMLSEPVPSVTEQTTRAFEPLPVGRKSK